MAGAANNSLIMRHRRLGQWRFNEHAQGRVSQRNVAALTQQAARLGMQKAQCVSGMPDKRRITLRVSEPTHFGAFSSWDAHGRARLGRSHMLLSALRSRLPRRRLLRLLLALLLPVGREPDGEVGLRDVDLQDAAPPLTPVVLCRTLISNWRCSWI